MKKLSVMVVALSMAATAFSAATVLPVSDGDVVLGQWNSNFTAGKAYAEQNHIPMLIFWGSEDCGYCSLLKKSLIKDDFTAWSASKQIVMIACEGKSGDNYNCWEFAKNSSGLFPYVCVYWLKSDGTTVVSRFTGRSNKIPVKIGTLGGKLMTYVDSLTEGYVPGGNPQPTPTPTPEPEPQPVIDPATVFAGGFEKSGILYDANENAAGIVTLKCQAEKKGKSKVSGTVRLLTGLKKAVRALSVSTGANAKAELTVTSLGTLNATFTRDSFTGTLAGYHIVPAVGTGPLGGNYKFESEFDMSFVPAKGYTPVAELMPADRAIATDASSINFGVYKAIKCAKVDGVWKYINADCENPCNIKVSYDMASGFITGTMYFYSAKVNARTGKPTLKRSSAKIYGVMLEGGAIMRIYVRNEVVGVATLSK